MKKIYFEDDQQDVLWWIIDDKGIVVASDMQENIWAGTEVSMTDNDINIENIKPGDHLVGVFKDKTPMLFGYAVEKIEAYQPKCRECRFLSERKTFGEGRYPSVRCTLGLWDAPPIVRWLSFGETILNRGPARRLGEACTQGLPKGMG